MITEFFIEGKRVDINADLSSLLTFAIDDVKDFASRSTAWSKTVVLPGTIRNNVTFGNLFEIGISNTYDPSIDNIGINFNPSKSARCLIFQDNLQTFKGTVRVLEVVVDNGRIEYEVALNGELTSLSVSLSSKLLEDLDFSVYDQMYSVANIIASWDNPGGSGVYYPLIDYGTYSTSKHDWGALTFRPALYVKEYIDKMFNAAGFKYTAPLFETSRFKKLIIPHNQKRLTSLSANVMEAGINSTKNNPSGAFAWDTVAGDNFTLEFSGTQIKYSGSTGLAGNISIACSGEYKYCDITISYSKNGGIPFLTKTYTYPGGGFTSFFSFNETVPMSLIANDFITCSVSFANVNPSLYGSKIYQNKVNFLSSTPVQVPIALNDMLKINDTLPRNIRQVDFLLSIVKLFNLYVYEDKFDEKHIKIAPYIDFYSTNSADSLDWTYKLNRDKPVKIRPLSELNSKIYNFLYKKDSDYYNDLYEKRYNLTYGSYIFDSQFEFTSNSSKAELIFAPTPIVGYSGQDKVYSTIFKMNNNVEETMDSVIRIMQSKKITGVSSWDIKNGLTTIATISDYGYAGHFNDPDAPDNDLNFGVVKELFFILASGDLTKTQFNIYWSEYMAEITDKDSKMLIANFYLTPKDIFNLNFSRYIFVDGILFRLNKILDYNSTIPNDCVVELLKVINTTYTESIPSPGETYFWIDSDGGYILDSDGSKIKFF
jgi:uncharacterized protein YwqG